jgi:hypothetical protein
MTILTPGLNALIVLRNIVGTLGILWGMYLFLRALPELPRYFRMTMK